MEPDAAYLREILTYDPGSGVFLWKFRQGVPCSWNTKYAGRMAGSQDKHGYWIIRVDHKHYKAHRLAWVYVTGESIPEFTEVDHRDNCRWNNSFANLRLASDLQNAQNSCLRKDNRSGFRGVSWHRAQRKWVAQISHKGTRMCLGYFDSPETAFEKFKVEATRLRGEFARI